MSIQIKCELVLPHWLESFVDDWPEPLETVEQRMLLAVSLSAENVRHGTGGPFGAIVVEEETSRLLVSDDVPFWGLVRSRVETSSHTRLESSRRKPRPKVTITESILISCTKR